MKITIEIDSKKEMEKLSALFETFKISAVNVVAANERIIPLIKGDKTIDPKALFGIWEKAPRSLEDIRKVAWDRKS
jgi:hypothetical protein